MIFVVLAAAAVLFAGGWYFFRFSCARNGSLTRGRENPSPWGRFQQRVEEGTAYLESCPMEDLYIESDDGLKLHALWFACEKPERIVILAHGFRGTAFGDFAGIAPFCHRNHCDLLLIDQRCCGKSEGKWITFGAYEKKDLKKWCEAVSERNSAHLPVFLFGISLGCASVLLASGENLPDDVRGLIGDCGYSSMRAILSQLSRKWFHIPPYPVMWIVELYCRLFAGFSMKDADVRETLKSCRLPVLLFHGREDHFVAPSNSAANYEAAASRKQLFLIDGAKHAVSYYADTPFYEQKVLAFFRRCAGR